MGHINLDPAVAEIIGGSVAGAANVISGFPFDTIKVRLQSNQGQYKGALHCCSHIWRKEGIPGFFRGLAPPLIGGALETGVNYMVYSRILNHFKGEAGEPPLSSVPVAAGAAGITLSFILGPTELIKCRMQLGGGRYRSSWHCIQQTIEQEGLRGLTRGLGATMIREVPGNALFFTVYEVLRRSLPGRPQRGALKQRTLGEVLRDAATAMFCGGMAGMVMWATVLPLDVAKTRLQTSEPGSRWDVGVRQHLRMLWHEGRYRSLWAGLTPVLVRAFPANACQWLAWELAMEQLSQVTDEPTH